MSDLTEIYKYLLDRETTSLSEMLKEKIDSFELSQRQASSLLGLQRTTLQRIMEEQAKKIDVLTFLKMLYFLESDMEEFLALFVASMPPDEIKELEYVRKAVLILRNFDLKAMQKMGIIEEINDFDAVERRIKDYFGIDRIEEYEYSLNALLSKTSRPFKDKVRNMWLKSVETAFRELDNPNPYNRDILEGMVRRIPGYTTNEEGGLLTVIRALFKVGVTVVYQPYPQNVQVRGATFFIKDKPCIVLTDYNKRYDTLWWCLLHEIYHVLYDSNVLKTTTFHLSGVEDAFLMEKNANEFASLTLLSEHHFSLVRPFINTDSMVRHYAKLWNIHPCFIYAAYMHENKGSEAQYRQYIPKSSVATKGINYSLAQKEASIKSIVKQIKNQVLGYGN